MACDCPVPWEQQPVNEYRSLMETWLFSWATDDVQSYGVKLALVGLAFAVLVGWPVTAMSFSPEKELMKCSMGALCGGILASTMAALRLYLGWAYVGNRLFSATVECTLSSILATLMLHLTSCSFSESVQGSC
jgi:hypothetical protein